MAMDNFVEMREKVADPVFLLRKQARPTLCIDLDNKSRLFVFSSLCVHSAICPFLFMKVEAIVEQTFTDKYRSRSVMVTVPGS